jgi:uncharacterized protein YerC
MAHAYYVTSFRHLTLPEPIPEFIELMPGMRLTTDNRVRRRLLTEDFRLAAGAIETDYLWSAPNIVFGEFGAEEMRGLPPDQFLLCVILWIDGLFRNCWLSHDHCMECDAAFLMAKQGNRRWTASRNYLSRRPTRRLFLRGLLSHTEIQRCADRWFVVKCLDRGMTFAKIREELKRDDATKVAGATLTRAKLAFERSGSGFRIALQRTKNRSKRRGSRRVGRH